jgi:hypothetical protein
MITILSMLEKGYESSFEHLTFRQLQGAYRIKLICVPHNFVTMEDALLEAEGTKIFMVPRGRWPHSTEFKEWTPPAGDLVFVFGSPQENLVKYINDDFALHITTKGYSDMMSVCVAAMVLYVHGQ